MNENKEKTKSYQEKLVETALKVQMRLNQERKTAPDNAQILDGALEEADIVLMKRYCPEALPAKLNDGKKPTMRCYFDYEGEHDLRLKKHVNVGWQPIVKDGEFVRRGQDIMFKRPIVFLTEQRKKNDALSLDGLKNTPLSKIPNSPDEGVSGNTALDIKTPG